MGMARRILASPRWVQKGLGSGQVVALNEESHLGILLSPPCLNLQEIVSKLFSWGEGRQIMSLASHSLQGLCPKVTSELSCSVKT